MRALNRLVLSVFLAAAGPLLAFGAAAGEQDWKPLVAKFRAEYPQSGPGAYVIAAKEGRVVFSRGFGQADLEHRVAMRAQSVVRIASLTKQFTSVAVLLLVQDGRLKLSDRLDSILKDCPEAWKAITIERLLNQTSGVTDDLSPLYRRMTTDMTVDQLLALYSGQPLVSAPGDTWQYSNLNYWILGKVIEVVSGEAYADFVTHRVLVRGMTQTRYGSHDAIIPDRALGYEADSKAGWVNARYFSTTLGYSAGGFLSTPQDMAIWYAALGHGDILTSKMLSLALSEGKTNDGKPTGYGLGWYVSDENGVHVARHGGSTFGFQCSIYWVPSRAIFVGVFKNSSDDRGEPDNDAKSLLNAALRG